MVAREKNTVTLLAADPESFMGGLCLFAFSRSQHQVQAGAGWAYPSVALAAGKAYGARHSSTALPARWGGMRSSRQSGPARGLALPLRAQNIPFVE